VQLQQRDEQIDSLQQQILGLERTRDRCTPGCSQVYISMEVQQAVHESTNGRTITKGPAFA
jgi:hypothetical protein